MNFNFTQQDEPSNDQLRAQLVALMHQLGVPVPPKPDISQFRSYKPDTVHELIHTVQADSMSESIQLMASKLTEASKSLNSPEVSVQKDAELAESIEEVLNTVSAKSLAVAKTVLDLQDIEDELREAKAPKIGGYL